MNHSGGGPSDDVDVGYLELNPSDCSEDDECGFLDIKRCRGRINHAPGQFIWIYGYPAEMARGVPSDRRIRVTPGIAFCVPTVDPTDWTSARREPGRDIVLAYEAQTELVHLLSGQTERIDAMLPNGMSGGGIWMADPNQRGKLWTAQATYLIGIDRAWNRDRWQLLGTQIQHWLGLVRRDYPDLSGAIDPLLASA